MPCVVLPLMAIMKLFEWIFAKFYGKKAESTTENANLRKAAGCPFSSMSSVLPNPHTAVAQSEATPLKAGGCPLASMGSSIPNPHTESEATSTKQVKQD